jgi:hypothetical protein
MQQGRTAIPALLTITPTPALLECGFSCSSCDAVGLDSTLLVTIMSLEDGGARLMSELGTRHSDSRALP